MVNRALVVAVGVDAEGRREMLGTACGPAETEAFWLEFLRSQAGRGLSGVRLVVSDAHEGLKSAIARELQATWQRSPVHFMRNALGHVPRRQHQMVATVMRTGFVQENQQDAQRQWRKTADKLRGRFAKLAELMDDAEHDVLAFMAFPKEHWSQIASTNPLERVNKEIKRRSRVVGIFPNDAAIVRLVGALLIEQTEEWHITPRYMSQESLAKIVTPETKLMIEEDRRAVTSQRFAPANCVHLIRSNNSLLGCNLLYPPTTSDRISGSDEDRVERPPRHRQSSGLEIR